MEGDHFNDLARSLTRRRAEPGVEVGSGEGFRFRGFLVADFFWYFFQMGLCFREQLLGAGNSNILGDFSPPKLGKIPTHLDGAHIFLDGLVQPPTRLGMDR